MKPKPIYIYGVPVCMKRDSKMMRFIGKLLSPFNKHFMKSYWTTWFGVVYAPDYFNIKNSHAWKSNEIRIKHEGIHIEDQKRHPILFPLTYIFPPVILAYGRWRWERKKRGHRV